MPSGKVLIQEIASESTYREDEFISGFGSDLPHISIYSVTDYNSVRDTFQVLFIHHYRPVQICILVVQTACLFTTMKRLHQQSIGQ